MLTTANLSVFAKQSQAADFIVGMRSVYVSTRGLFNNVIWVMILPIGVGLTWLVLRFIYWQLRQNTPTQVDLTIDNYKEIRREYDNLTIAQQKLGSILIQGDSMKAVPYLLRGIMGLIAKINGIISNHRDMLSNALKSLNDDAPVTHLLRSVAEEELWSNRAKAYQYRF